MRFLCLSDIHGQLAALQAVLASAERRGFDQILVAGDLCFPGPEPLETFRTLKRLRAICVQGVTDRALATLAPARIEEAALDETHRRLARRFAETRTAIGELVLESLRRLPTHHRIPLEDGREMVLVHGSPADPTEAITHDLDDEEVGALIGDDPADVIVCGMSHVPFVREVAGLMIVNAGSVGEAPGGSVAHAVFIDVTAAGIIVDPISVPVELDNSAVV